MTKASLAQGKQLLELFSGASAEQLQMLIENGDIIKLLLAAPLGEVDRFSLASALQQRAMTLSEACMEGVREREWIQVWARYRIRYTNNDGTGGRPYVSIDLDDNDYAIRLPKDAMIIRLAETEVHE